MPRPSLTLLLATTIVLAIPHLTQAQITFPNEVQALNTNAADDGSDNDSYPQITTDGTGIWMAVWQSDYNLNNFIGIDTDILYAVSTDDGASWSEPAALNSNAASDSGEDLDPQLTTNSSGNWIAVWHSSDSLGGTIGTDYDILYAVSTNNGASWSAPAALNSNATTDSGNDENPQFTTDRFGNWIAVWSSYDSLGNTIGLDGDVLYVVSNDYGSTWSAPAALNSNAESDFQSDVTPQLTTDNGGDWIAVWSSYDSLGNTIGTDSDILYAVSTDNGSTWSAPTALNLNASSDSNSNHDFTPQITSDESGNWIATWMSHDLFGGTFGFDYDIFYAISTNDGATWSAPAALNSNAASDSGNDFNPQFTTDNGGNWIAVWFSNDALSGAIGTDHDILYAVSTNNGATWSAPAALNSNAATDIGHDYYPQLITDDSGNWIALWQTVGFVGGNFDVDDDVLYSVSTDYGATWSAPVALNPNADSDFTYDTSPELTTDDNGNWIAVWQSDDSLGGTIGTDYDILYAVSTDDGATWSAPAALNLNADSDSGNDRYAQLTTDANGNWIAVWQSEDSLSGTIGTDSDVLYAISTNNGSTWAAPASLNSNAINDSGFDVGPQLTTNGSGNWIALWHSGESLSNTIGGDLDILYATSTNDGVTWSAPAALNTNAASDTGSDFVPQLTTDAGGNWIAVWHSTDSLGGTISTDYDILYALSTDNGATWSAPAALNSNAASDSGGDHNPQLTTDASGSWIALWSTNESLNDTISIDYDILFALSTNNGATWSAPAALNSNAAADIGADYFPQLTTDASGNWIAIWHSFDSLGGAINTDYDILYALSTDSGTSWSAPVALNSNADTDAGDDLYPQLTTDANGNWIALWASRASLNDTIGGDYDILFTIADDPNGDTDGDGMPDAWEIANGLDPNIYDAGQDPDGDGLTNLREYLQGTDPQDWDTDDDGLSDGEEVDVYHTDPNDSDSDDDTFLDGFEIEIGTDPLDDTSVPDVYPPLRFRVRDASNLVPITTAQVNLRVDGEVVSNSAEILTEAEAGELGIYETRPLSPGFYDVSAVAPGYQLKTLQNPVEPYPGGRSTIDINLAKDTNLEKTNTIEISILNLETVDPSYLLTTSVSVEQQGVEQDVGVLFVDNKIKLIGVPNGEVDIIVSSVDSYDIFSPTDAQQSSSTGVETLTLATGIQTELEYTAERNSGAGTLPAILIGDVTDATTATPIRGAYVVARRVGGTTTYWDDTGSTGVYNFPDIVGGTYDVQAYSANGFITSPIRQFELINGQTYGDDQQSENTRLTLPLTQSDPDGDGLESSWEAFFGLDPNDARGTNGHGADADADGLTNLGENFLGLDPNDPDSDNDEYSDGVEAAHGSDPYPGSGVSSVPGTSETWIDLGFQTFANKGTIDAPFRYLDDAINIIIDEGIVWIKGDVNTTSSTTPFSPGTNTYPLQIQSSPQVTYTIQAKRGTIRLGEN